MAYKPGTWKIKKEQERLFAKYGENYKVIQRSQPAPVKNAAYRNKTGKPTSIPII